MYRFSSCFLEMYKFSLCFPILFCFFLLVLSFHLIEEIARNIQNVRYLANRVRDLFVFSDLSVEVGLKFVGRKVVVVVVRGEIVRGAADRVVIVSSVHH